MNAVREAAHLGVPAFASMFTLGECPYLEEGVVEIVTHRAPAPRATGQGIVDGAQLPGPAEETEHTSVVIVGHRLPPSYARRKCSAYAHGCTIPRGS